jgi:hypothetical protein
MMVAVMAQIVTMFRRRPGTATGAAAAVVMAGDQTAVRPLSHPPRVYPSWTS